MAFESFYCPITVIFRLRCNESVTPRAFFKHFFSQAFIFDPSHSLQVKGGHDPRHQVDPLSPDIDN